MDQLPPSTDRLRSRRTRIKSVVPVVGPVLLVVALLFIIYGVPTDTVVRTLFLEVLALSYGVYVVWAIARGKPVQIAAVTVNPGNAPALRVFSFLVGVALIVVSLYFLAT